MSNKLQSRAGGKTTSKGLQQDNVPIDSVGFNTTVSNQIRELTKHGIETSHISAKNVGPGRQIQDRTFFINLLKQKTNSINKEITNIKGETEKINKDINEYFTLTKQYEGLSKEVQNLEGELADYNLAGDKYRSNMRAEDIESFYNHIKTVNKKKRDYVDEIYIDKSKKEEELASVEEETNETLRMLEQKLLDLDPDQHIEYEQLRDENNYLNKKIYEIRDEIHRLNIDLIEGEKFLKNNPNKKEAHKLKENILNLQKRKDDLQLQLNDSGLSVDEWKVKLVNKYKQEGEDKLLIDKKIADAKKIVDNVKKSIIEIENESNNSSSVEKLKAHDSIISKDKEYTKFIDSFGENKRILLKQLESKEEIVMNLLESHSNKLTNKSSGNKKNNYKSELEYKKNQVNKSVSTLEETKALYESLQIKSKRLTDLEPSLKSEIKNFQDKIERCKSDISDKFDRVDFQKNYYKNEISKMQELLMFLEKNKNSYKTLLEAMRFKAKSKQTQLEEMDSFKKLRELEKKMQENENYIHSLVTYIDSKEKESDFSQIMKECMDLQQEINNELISKTLSIKI